MCVAMRSCGASPLHPIQLDSLRTQMSLAYLVLLSVNRLDPLRLGPTAPHDVLGDTATLPCNKLHNLPSSARSCMLDSRLGHNQELISIFWEFFVYICIESEFATSLYGHKALQSLRLFTDKDMAAAESGSCNICGCTDFAQVCNTATTPSL